jgi:hypothetical protein
LEVSVDVRFDGQKLTIDNIIDVTKKDNDYLFQCGYHKIAVTPPGFDDQRRGITPGWLAVERDPIQQKDPHYYKNGNNNLTIEDSVDRAIDTIIYSTWDYYDSDTVGDIHLLIDAVTKIIKKGEGRDRAYAIAGSIAKGVREGRFKGVPLAFLFHGIVDGHITEPVKVEARGLPSTIRF